MAPIKIKDTKLPQKGHLAVLCKMLFEEVIGEINLLVTELKEDGALIESVFSPFNESR